MSSPKHWGKHFWHTMHITALGYPESPTPEQIAAYKVFYTNFGNILPCKKCARNYAKHLQELPIEPALENKKKLFAWTVDLHNIVNRETGKSYWNREYAEAFYLSGGYDNCACDNEVATAWRVAWILMIIINLIAVAFLLRKLSK